MASEGCEKASALEYFSQFHWRSVQPYSSAGTTVLSHSALVLQLNTNPCRAVFKLDLCSNKYRLKNSVWWLYLEYPGRDVRITTSLGVGGFFFFPFLVIVAVVFQELGVIFFFPCRSKITWNAKVEDFVTCFHSSREKHILEFPACQRSERSVVQHVHLGALDHSFCRI